MSKQFSDLGISEVLLKGLSDLNISVPTEIQEKSIPDLLGKKDDFVGLAKTGTGKTLAFGLPLLQLIDTDNKNIQAVILVPTRELGHQIYDNMMAFSKYQDKLSIAAPAEGFRLNRKLNALLSLHML